MSEPLQVDAVSYAATLAQRNRYREKSERLRAELVAAHEALRETQRAAYIAGFMATIEGFNGEHPYEGYTAEQMAGELKEGLDELYPLGPEVR